jgi:hypothetical protein
MEFFRFEKFLIVRARKCVCGLMQKELQDKT